MSKSQIEFEIKKIDEVLENVILPQQIVFDLRSYKRELLKQLEKESVE